MMGKKPASPSTLKRNAERRQAFLAKKNAQVPLSHVIQADLATNQQVIEKGSYQCIGATAPMRTAVIVLVAVVDRPRVIEESFVNVGQLYAVIVPLLSILLMYHATFS